MAIWEVITMSRYKRRIKAINDNELYDKLFEKRGVKKITQYRTPESVNVPQEVLDSIETVEHVWSYGDAFWKLAARYYGDPRMWWVIASYNRKPTDTHMELGDLIRIPISLADALGVVS